MKLSTSSLPFLISALLSACTISSDYHKLEDGIGYSEEKIGTNIFEVTYHGHPENSEDEVEHHLLRRVTELATIEGVDHFTIVDKHSDCITTLQTSLNSTCSFRQSTEDPFPYFFPEVSSANLTKEYEATAYVVMGNNTNCDAHPQCFETKTALTLLDSTRHDVDTSVRQSLSDILVVSTHCC